MSVINNFDLNYSPRSDLQSRAEHISANNFTNFRQLDLNGGIPKIV